MGWLYLIKNGDLYKIGITRNFENRMKQLKPDKVVAKIYTTNFMKLERELHKRYKDVRIPQTEYFRLNPNHIREINKRLSYFYSPMNISFSAFINSISLLILLAVLVLLYTTLTINNINNVVLSSLILMERLTIFLSFLSLLIKSNKYLSLLNEFKYRMSRSFILFLFSFIFNFIQIVLF